MQITVNGEARAVTDGQSVASLLADLGIQAERVAVEVNLAIVERRVFPETLLNDGDRVEIISFIGGGGAGMGWRSDDDG